MKQKNHGAIKETLDFPADRHLIDNIVESIAGNINGFWKEFTPSRTSAALRI